MLNYFENFPQTITAEEPCLKGYLNVSCLSSDHKQWITYIMGTGVPLLNEYKQEFVAKRFPQTVLGGLKLRVGYNAPVYVYVSQLMVFIVPFLLGGGFTLLVELEAMGKYTAVYVYGGLMAAYVLLIQLISHIVQVSRVFPYYLN
ncbi:hypothetical protein DPMN_087895 [Dreissena polymorpha]|uniref:Pecanex-like protein n=1 Tax=Dreissena polymorpha TaxID=45954 RepID=A0A9D4KU21_DREPO|nr:hypothetical protein DPMN_087895 [Dreissena polymorpha]